MVIWMHERVGIGKDPSEFVWTFDVADERYPVWKIKLAVLLHKLWVNGEVYEPLRNHPTAVDAVA